ncbi:unnamed protein product [Linum tenue]|uniref:GDSL esterase/lipase n=1 Tax=Linum tenue TaxID=586396 RepID=A0AAV0KBA1_9ROSI|nr:unnamed protein product [Linum tenue]
MAQRRPPQTQEAQVPCFFIFGDSLVDNGNNNGMLTLARANYGPYGIDFPLGATGRFTNGVENLRNAQRLIGNPQEERARAPREVLRGVNFASGAAGIREETGNNLKMYTMGARKVIVTSVGQIGCIPYQLASNNSSRCNEKINDAVSMFNSGLKRLVQRFNGGTELPGAKFVYLDFYKSTSDLYRNSSQYGFEVIDKGCCGVGRNNGQITCLPLQQPCPDRRKYLFWDAFHPTELANVLLAQSSFSTQSFTYPINIQQLAMS